MKKLTPEQEEIVNNAHNSLEYEQDEIKRHAIISDAVARAIKPVQQKFDYALKGNRKYKSQIKSLAERAQVDEERAEFHHNKAIETENQLQQELINHAKTKMELAHWKDIAHTGGVAHK